MGTEKEKGKRKSENCIYADALTRRPHPSSPFPGTAAVKGVLIALSNFHFTHHQY